MRLLASNKLRIGSRMRWTIPANRKALSIRSGDSDQQRPTIYDQYVELLRSDPTTYLMSFPISRGSSIASCCRSASLWMPAKIASRRGLIPRWQIHRAGC